MTRKELEQAKRDLMEIQQEREKVREGTKEGKKLIKRCLAGAVLTCGLAVSIVMGAFYLEEDTYVQHKTTNVYTNEIVQEVERDYTKAVYHRTRYVLYSPWKYDGFSGTYERNVKEYEYAHLAGEVNVDNVQSLTLVEAYLEKKDSLDRSDSVTEPTLLMEEYVKEKGMTDWKREYSKKVFGIASIMSGIMTGLFCTGLILAIMGDENFYGYRIREKMLKAQENEIKAKIDPKEKPYILQKVRQ